MNELSKKSVTCLLRKHDYPIGIISAFTNEIVALTGLLTPLYGYTDIKGRRYFLCVYDHRFIVYVICGIGITNATMTTQNMIDIFKPKLLIFSGIAGGVDPNLRIGDVIFPKQWAQYQHHKIVRDADGFKSFQDVLIDFPDTFYQKDGKVVSFLRPDCGQCDLPLPPNFSNGEVNAQGVLETDKFAIPMLVETFTQGQDAFDVNVPERFWMDADKELVKIADQLVNSGVTIPVTIKPDPNDPSTWYVPTMMVADNGLSASTFLDNNDYRQQLFDTFGSSGVDMESAAFAHVCVSNTKPFIVIRSLSDLAGGSAGENAILSFLTNAAEITIFVLTSYLSLIPKNLWSKQHCRRKHRCRRDHRDRHHRKHSHHGCDRCDRCDHDHCGRH
jgi:adenosylhomocysteine nucleosidase